MRTGTFGIGKMFFNFLLFTDDHVGLSGLIACKQGAAGSIVSCIDFLLRMSKRSLVLLVKMLTGMLC